MRIKIRIEVPTSVHLFEKGIFGTSHSLKNGCFQYSRIENSKREPSFNIVAKITNTLGVTLSELFRADEISTDLHSHDKKIMDKLRHLVTLEDKGKQSLYPIIDTFMAKKKLKDNLVSLADQ